MRRPRGVVPSGHVQVRCRSPPLANLFIHPLLCHTPRVGGFHLCPPATGSGCREQRACFSKSIGHMVADRSFGSIGLEIDVSESPGGV